MEKKNKEKIKYKFNNRYRLEKKPVGENHKTYERTWSRVKNGHDKIWNAL
jgi:hypothetical protein